MLRHLLESPGERGATAVEYALIISGIALALVAATFLLGDTLSAKLEDMASFLR